LQVYYIKPAKYKAVLNKPGKPEEKKLSDELCRFAGLFSIGPAKNTRFFHSMEQIWGFVENMWKSQHKAVLHVILRKANF
jgi:hypothetical protein